MFGSKRRMRGIGIVRLALPEGKQGWMEAGLPVEKAA
jgi:hypothetical protein